jgi:hypothetical protein
MWVNLDDAERNYLLTMIPDGPLAEKLRDKADAEAGAFMAAVPVNDGLEMDPDAVVSRGDDGAFVMTWKWVSNEEAGIEPWNDEDDDMETVAPLGP